MGGEGMFLTWAGPGSPGIAADSRGLERHLHPGATVRDTDSATDEAHAWKTSRGTGLPTVQATGPWVESAPRFGRDQYIGFPDPS